MPRVLTVDDSRAIRQIVTRQLAELGCETDEAEDGEKGLERAAAQSFDLILLDVTMPVMDGPEMLKRLRESGNQTPVIMLTSESKRSVVAGALRLGIVEYILKPFKNDELQAKVQQVLKLDLPVKAAPEAVPQVGNSRSEVKTAAGSAGKQFVDVLVVDDMENVYKKLRTLLPAELSVDGATSAQAALNLCREKVYRLILLDTVIPDVNSAALMNQMRAMQTNAVFVALMLRTSGDAAEETRAQGYVGHLFKPFDGLSIDELLVRYFEDQELVDAAQNVISARVCRSRDDRLDKYFGLLGEQLRTEMEKVAEACHDEAIIDLTQAPLRADKTTRLVIELGKQAARMGLQLRVVGGEPLRKLLAEFTDTRAVACFASVDQAQTGKAA